MSSNSVNTWLPIIVVVLAGAIATALVPQTVPILGAIAEEFSVDRGHLGWLVSFPTMVCAFGALAFGVVVDRLGDVKLLLAGVVLVILGDAGVSLAPALDWLFAARLFQGFGYVCITVAAPTFIQRTTTGDTRRAAMAFWAAHTPIGFAAAVYFGAQLLAVGLSWRWSFLGHATAALLVGIAALTLSHAPSAAKVSRSAGIWQVLTSVKAYLVALGAAAAAMLQVSVMVMVPSMMTGQYGLSGPQSAFVVVMAMLCCWCGSMLVVATRVRNMPGMALPLTALAAAFFGFAIVSELAETLSMVLAQIMLFAATIGTANALVWSFLPAAAPSHETAGATAGLITQGSFLGVLIGPPTFFWIRHQSPVLVALLALVLAILMLVSLFAHAPTGRPGIGKALSAADAH